jgi:hypothetical protein
VIIYPLPLMDRVSTPQILHVLCVWLALTFSMSLPARAEPSHGKERTIPFHPGEQLRFEVRWTIIPAGEAVLEVLPPVNLSGVTCFHFAVTARSSEFVDLFYKVRDMIDAYADNTMSRSIQFKKVQGARSRRNVVVDFDWRKGEVQYSESGEKRAPLSIPPGSFDPLSVFYAFRTHPLEAGKEINVPVTDGKKCVMGTARVLSREKIEVAGRTFDTFLVEPEMKHIGGIFEKGKKSRLQIWVTADSDRVPVRVKGGVVVGSFVAELVSWKRGEERFGRDQED